MEVDLLSILEDGKKQLELLVQLAGEKQQAIVENKRDAVAELSQRELELTDSLQNWEQARLEKTGQAKLAQLAQRLDPPSRLKVTNLGQEIIFLTEQLTALNAQNAELLKHALAYTEYCLSLFQADSQTYGQKNEGKLTFLDRKI